jgi:hypothetical protein
VPRTNAQRYRRNAYHNLGLDVCTADAREVLRERGVFLRSLTEGFDTSTASGRLLYHVLGAVAEFEREVIKERTVAGMKAAKKRGTHVGRPQALVGSRLAEAGRMLAAGKSQIETARILRVSRATIQRAYPGGSGKGEDAYSEMILCGRGVRESRKSCAFCANRAIVQCDGDRCIHNVCDDHRWSAAENLDFCPLCERAVLLAAATPKQTELFGSR